MNILSVLKASEDFHAVINIVISLISDTVNIYSITLTLGTAERLKRVRNTTEFFEILTDTSVVLEIC